MGDFLLLVLKKKKREKKKKLISVKSFDWLLISHWMQRTKIIL